jgi:hypothetical protein
MKRSVGAVLASGFAVLASGFLGACAPSGAARLVTKSGENASANIRTNDVESPNAGADTSLGEFLIKPEACAGIDIRPDYTPLTVGHFEAFLTAQNITFQRIRARDDLHYLDSTIDGEGVRFRVATLTSPRDAARDLYEALLQHGKGAWGVHRSNLAVLAPIGKTEDDIVGFAVRTKLACWGVLSAAGRDDAFVIPGGYYEP